MSRRSPGTLLARLGGGDPAVLRQVPSAKGRFIQMGLVLLSTASLALLSMSFALVDGLRASWPVAISLGAAWGFVILNIDRMLIQNIRPGGSIARTILMLLPRLLIAGLLGVVISTPLVLRVFEPEIVANMQQENAQQANHLGDLRQDSPEAKRLAEVEGKIKTNEAILAGDLPGLTNPNVAAAEEQLEKAEADLAAKRDDANRAYRRWRCELDGDSCEGASEKRGNGPRARALKREYDILAAELESAQAAVNVARGAVEEAAEEATESNLVALEEAQDKARSELPALQEERAELDSQLAVTRSDDSTAQAGNTGLLARITALHRIGEESTSALISHLAVGLLIFMIELLPVLIKVLASFGPRSLYDRISELEDKSVYDNATQRRNDERRRIENESKKRRKIEDNMLEEEVRIGVKANKHVANEMEKILDVALEQWSREVGETIKANGNPPTGRAGGDRAGQASRPPDHGVRSRYGLPAEGAL